jgi:hypothetical protein
MALVDLPYHARVKRELNQPQSFWDWIKENPANPVVGDFTIHFVFQCAKHDKGKFFMLRHMVQEVKMEILKQADAESFAREASI